MTTASCSVIGRRARKRLEKSGELLHRAALQQASAADSCDSELRELGVRRGWRDLQDIDRARSVRDEALRASRSQSRIGNTQPAPASCLITSIASQRADW
jgi:hypothetical protein